MSQVLKVFSIFILMYTADALQCLNENGSPVDWAYVYKLPRSEKSDNELIKKGVAYIYMTSDKIRWTLSKFGIDDDASILSKHIKIHLEKKDDLTHLVYNDVLPNGEENKTAGHTKGLILADSDGGLWATGTIPGYPGPDMTYPEIGKIKGEFFSCVSMDLKNLDNAGPALRCREAQIYDSHIATGMEASLPMLSSVIKGEPSKANATKVKVDFLSSRDGMRVGILSKSSELNGDIYKKVIGTLVLEDLYVRSAISKEDGLPSDCKAPRVLNIESIFIKAAGMTIPNEEDNAKWAMGNSFIGSWICIGDMDRNESEKHRGGGAFCMLSKTVVKQFNKMIRSVEECP
ncbi:unnamed protein product [Phaedon cochleariae]|uniref:Uncharacterized protein n=1 Tax=Phaedon cochleariae TaxID=80249 RepID=A0A9P0GUI7_PHACE|nr:unnamed protein product [Phaedon cochleariae]